MCRHICEYLSSRTFPVLTALVLLAVTPYVSAQYVVVDTGQVTCYNDSTGIVAPAPGDAFYGQDAQYDGNQPSYTVGADGLTVHDNHTGLTWTRNPDLDGDGDIDAYDKLTYYEAQTYPDTLNAQNSAATTTGGCPPSKNGTR